MIFYVSLFIACVIAAFLVLYLYHALANAGRGVSKVLLPGTKDNVAGHAERTRNHSTKNKTPTPWGWKGNGSVIRDHDAQSAAVNGASGLDAFLNDHDKESASVGWPYREEKTELAGRANKVSRKAGSAKTGRRSGGKPWGW